MFQCWGVFENKLYLIDQIRGKWEAVDLERHFIAFYNKHNRPTASIGRLRCCYVEDKVSGTGLIQSVRAEYSIPIEPIKRGDKRNKVTRAKDNVRFISSGYVHLPANAVWLSDYLAEFGRFTDLMNHKHDDQIDPTLDAIELELRMNSDPTW